MIDILIPTYNRSKDLLKNIKHIDSLIETEKLTDKFRIIISNNASTDDTSITLEKIKNEVNIQLIIYQQKQNIGLEKNAVFVLENATSDYVMFLGDDDYLPNNYLTELVAIADFKKYGLVIPGFSALMPDGEIKKGRIDFKSREHIAGFKAVKDLSSFGHQLSGLFFKRKDVVEAYTSDFKNRNIYLFIFFISYVMLKEKSIYLPEYQVLVTQGNSKDWSYDDSGLLTEIFKNYYALYPDARLKALNLCLNFIRKQSWRLRLRNPLLAKKSFMHLVTSQNVNPFLKFILPVFYPYLYLEKTLSIVTRKIQ
ncbi:glycosyltransferase family 2 protein [Thiothrix subterranea]|uniref:glycosyltransferase family 2 protein n=1 Tax=Thiothrix subterranea TaxID=2735563 RepID=UPI00280A596C|nr:glycosyltransferase family 2 protein [Thiothrix subterranea]